MGMETERSGVGGFGPLLSIEDLAGTRNTDHLLDQTRRYMSHHSRRNDAPPKDVRIAVWTQTRLVRDDPWVSGIVGQAVERLRAAGVNLAPGLNEQELTRIEERFGFTFGPEHRELLATAIPDGESWVDWRHGSTDSLSSRLSWPIEGVIFDVQNNGFWPTSWGERPSGPGPIERQARDHLARVPQLVPLFSHRYLVAGAAYVPSPVFSVYQTDVIYYGDNLLDYVAHEFNVPPLCPSRKCPHVPFWSGLADGLDAADL